MEVTPGLFGVTTPFSSISATLGSLLDQVTVLCSSFVGPLTLAVRVTGFLSFINKLLRLMVTLRTCTGGAGVGVGPVLGEGGGVDVSVSLGMIVTVRVSVWLLVPSVTVTSISTFVSAVTSFAVSALLVSPFPSVVVSAVSKSTAFPPLFIDQLTVSPLAAAGVSSTPSLATLAVNVDVSPAFNDVEEAVRLIDKSPSAAHAGALRENSRANARITAPARCKRVCFIVCTPQK